MASTAYRIENITTTICKVDLTEVAELFEDITLADLNRRERGIDLLTDTD